MISMMKWPNYSLKGFILAVMSMHILLDFIERMDVYIIKYVCLNSKQMYDHIDIIVNLKWYREYSN